MEFGVSFPTYVRAYEDVRRAEDLGFSHAWFDDSHMCYSELFSTMALAAHHSSRIRLGTFVLVPGNRIAPVVASAMATLNAIAPGRLILGVGAGFTGRNVMGFGPVARETIREHVEICRALMAGREARYSENGEERLIRFLHPDLGFVNVRDAIPIYVAANAPKMQELAGQAADGWIYAGCDPEGVRHGLGNVINSAQVAGRSGAIREVVALASACVLRPGDAVTSKRVINRVGPHAMVGLHTYWRPGEIPVSMFGPPALRTLAERYHRDYIMRMRTPLEKRFQEIHLGHLIFLKPGEEAYVNEDLIRLMSVTGTRDEVLTRLKELENAGVNQFVVRIVGTDARETLQEFSREIIGHYC